MKHEPIPVPPQTDDSPRPGPRWTNRKMAEFLRALAATHSVKAAAKSVGMSRQSAYRLRSRLKGKAFDTAWDEAFRHSYENLPYAALDRALNGVEVPHYYKGELIGTSRRFDERLTVTMLKMISSDGCLVVGSEIRGASDRGRRFQAMVDAIERDGEAAASPAQPGSFAADSPDVSPMSDARIMAELRGSRRYRAR
jgi:hypothetical protein